MVSAATMGDMERTNLVGSHCEGMNIGRFYSVAVFQPELKGVHLFRRRITKNALLASRCATLFRDERIGDDPRDPKAPNACYTLRSNQDVSLGRKTAIGTNA